MDNSELELRELADSLRGEIATFRALSDRCCIYRIPPRFHRFDESQCKPEVVSIGPFHYGKAELAAMEERKIGFLNRFVQRTGVSIEEFLWFVKDREADLRASYAEIINFPSGELVKIIFVDAVFLIDFLLGPRNRLMETEIFFDICKLENQLPMFILQGLFDLARGRRSPNNHELNVPFYELMRALPSNLINIRFLQNHALEAHVDAANHLLDFLRRCLQPPNLGNANEDRGTLSIPTITELHQAGVKFRLRLDRQLFDIRFINGVLEIPKIDVFSGTELLYRNMLAFEQFQMETHYLSDFILLISHLVKTRKDEELLIRNGVTETTIWNLEGEANIFGTLVRESIFNAENFYYSDLVGRLRAYCGIRRHRWKAILKQNYFNTPWASISVIAATLLLLLTLTQAIFSILSFLAR